MYQFLPPADCLLKQTSVEPFLLGAYTQHHVTLVKVTAL